MSAAGDRRAGRRVRLVLIALLGFVPLLAAAAPLSSGEIGETCAGAEDAAHCGRLIETRQLARLPGLARRDGSALVVSLFPAGNATFIDDDDPVKGTSYSLWDYIDGINSVVLYVTAGDHARFTLLQRATNRRIDLPAAPRLSPDRQRLAVADICLERCANEIAVWRVMREGFHKELRWTPLASWADADAAWRDADTLAIAYTVAATGVTATVERKLDDRSWTRLSP